MKIRRITIKNFRGVKELEWNLPTADIFCLIGKGDSSKSTILEAIRYAFYPQWNLTLSDSDFYQCKVENYIAIEVTIGDLVEEFCSLNKYGNYLRGWDAAAQKLTDEPDDHLENVLTVRLTVEKDFEPKWTAVCDRSPEGVPFKQADRNKVSVGLIGAYSEKQLSWATGTALANLTEAQSLNELLANASRTARTSLDADRPLTLKNFDAAAAKSQEVAKLLGVPVVHTYKAHLDLTSINLKVGGLTLHDGDMPLRQLGLGSRRMLLCGIQTVGLEDGHITLFDEVEFGLEPHRITRLIKHVRDDKRGQYFLTTHSPIVLRELTVKELHIVHNKGGVVQIISAAKEGLEEYGMQGKIRSSTEAFLAKKVVVCEGATEVGFLRGFDDHQVENKKDSFSFHGVALVDAGGGSKVRGMAKAFKSLGYDVSVLADADAEDQFSSADVDELERFGIPVHVWTERLSLEERAFQDLPWASVLASVQLAQDELGFSAHDQVRSKYPQGLDKNISSWEESSALRNSIGAAAKKSGWFKRMTEGELWFKTISPAFQDAAFCKKNLALELNELWGWAEHV
ncbi:ATP-dependent nuclease [Azotobacter beijerinckii]|uniref:Predicted ATP-dependent endonuclease of the OLD family, contains P-loop ATPase and TOPRIM domains n=1 Tax=Azotobacter beijerinckii TaxID=170623 RepID=A0A1I4IHJ2_9GAMM|nr:AAA family ATPase [Azotobacter beijerinckii]SFL53281.1 Predicted ATP-dependent endonuclease of the OLD family, contains P-loop ATPase and TOPRIM domains [Azotobacter beijerinckii]